MQKRGLLHRTLVVFTSDHGEGLMDTGQMWHGDSVLDEGVRVPLFFVVPGMPGALIDRTVGNIDIVPTIVDLLGGSPRRSMRGQSLVPLMLDPQRPFDRSYYIEAEGDARSALVQADQKHIFDHRTKLHIHFDLGLDPAEDHNVFDPTRPSHRRLLGELVERRPGLFERGLSDDATQGLLDQTLAAVDASAPLETLSFLLDLIRLSPSSSRRDAALRLFARATNDETRALIVERLYDEAETELEPLLQKLLLAEVQQGETGLLTALSEGDVPRAAHEALRPAFARAGDGDSDPAPWLVLISRFALEREDEVVSLRKLLARAKAAGGADPAALQLGLSAIARARQLPDREQRALSELALSLLDDPRPSVEAAACRALGRLGDPRAEALLEQRLYGRPFVVRLGAMHGLAPLIGSALEPHLLRIAREPGYTLNAVVLLEQVGTEKSEELLRWVATHGERPFTRNKAKQVQRTIRARSERAKDVPG
jgi:hypothetical protein